MYSGGYLFTPCTKELHITVVIYNVIGYTSVIPHTFIPFGNGK